MSGYKVDKMEYLKRKFCEFFRYFSIKKELPALQIKHFSRFLIINVRSV